MQVFTAFVFVLCVSFATAEELSKEGLIDRVAKLEGIINEVLKKVAGHLSIIDEVEISVLKLQAVLLKQLAETVNGLPILSDLLLPGLEKTLEGIEATVAATVKKIETLILGESTTPKPATPPTIRLTSGAKISLIPSTSRIV